MTAGYKADTSWCFGASRLTNKILGTERSPIPRGLQKSLQRYRQ